MSKVVKKIARTVKKVVKGAVNVVKKVVRSPIGKALLIGAATFFGVPMIAGALGGAAAGTGIAGTISGAISGAGSGLAQAWGGLTGAVSAMGAGNFSGAASALSGGFSPTAAYGASSGSGVLGITDIGVGTAGAGGGGGFGSIDMAGVLAEHAGKLPEGLRAVNASAQQPSSQGGGFLDGILKSATPALIQGGASMVGAIGQQKMEQERIKEQEAAAQRLRDEERAYRNASMGVILASPQDPGTGSYQRTKFANS